MPQTVPMGFEFEGLGEQPTRTLNGGSDGLSPILAEQVNDALVDVLADVADLQARLAEAEAEQNWEAVTDVDNATISGISSTSYTTAGGGVVGVTFKGPRTGAVIVHFYGVLEDTSNANNTLLSPEVREGATIGSGTVVRAAADDIAVRELTNIRHKYGAHLPVFGLTPGADYNARLLHRVTAGSTGAVDDRRITVTRA